MLNSDAPNCYITADIELSSIVFFCCYFCSIFPVVFFWLSQ